MPSGSNPTLNWAPFFFFFYNLRSADFFFYWFPKKLCSNLLYENYTCHNSYKHIFCMFCPKLPASSFIIIKNSLILKCWPKSLLHEVSPDYYGLKWVFFLLIFYYVFICFVYWTARRSKQSILKKSTLNTHWKAWCWSWSSSIWPLDANSWLIGKDS